MSINQPRCPECNRRYDLVLSNVIVDTYAVGDDGRYRHVEKKTEICSDADAGEHECWFSCHGCGHTDHSLVAPDETGRLFEWEHTCDDEGYDIVQKTGELKE